MDFSKFSDEDLEAISSGNMAGVSDEALSALAGTPAPTAPADRKWYDLRSDDPNDQLPMQMDFLNDPGARRAGQDALGFGFGNEATAGLKSLVSDQPYDEILQGYEQEKAGAAPADRLKAEVLGGAGGAGTMAMKLLNPKTWLGKTALGGTVGGVEGAGLAKPDERLEGGAAGSAFGTAGAVAAPTVMALGRGAKDAGKGVMNMIRQAPEPKVPQAEMQAYDILSEVSKRTGNTLPGAIGDGTRLGPQATVADLMGDEGAHSLQYATKGSEGARQVADESIIPMRAKEAPVRVREDVGVSPTDADRVLSVRDNLRSVEKATGSEIDTAVKQYATEALPNQKELNEFLKKFPEVRTAAIKARKQFGSGKTKYANTGSEHEAFVEQNLDALMDPKSKLHKDLLENSTDYEDIMAAARKKSRNAVVDVELEDFIRKELQSKINRSNNPLAKDSVKGARNIDAKAQWDEIAEKGLPDDLKSLRGQYGVDAQNVRAYDDGMKFSGMSETDVKRWMRGTPENPRTDAEIDAFRSGALEDISNKGEGVGAMLGKVDQNNKFKSVFGDEETQRVKGILDREDVFANTAKKQQAGTDAGRAQDIAGEVSGDAKGFLSGGSLRGKRAYSQTGAAFMLMNEVLNSMGLNSVSQTTQREMAKILTESDNLPGFINRLESTRLSKEAEDVLTALRRRQLAIQAGAVSGILGANNGNKGDNQ